MSARHIRARSTRVRIAVGGTLLAAALVAMAMVPARAATPATTTATGNRPTPSVTRLPIFYYGVFADRRWNGAIQLTLTATGRSVIVNGIAPGPCSDRDFGPMTPGKDGATGVVFSSVRNAPVRANGTFRIVERRAGRARPFRAATTLIVTGTFSGRRVTGRLRGSRTTNYDSCTADVRFTATRRLN